MSDEERRDAGVGDPPAREKGGMILKPGQRAGEAMRGIDLPKLFEQTGLILLFALVIVVFGVLRGETFLTPANWRSIATSQSVLGVAAIALMVPLIGNRFDISVGANLGICAMACGAVMRDLGLPLPLAVIVGIALGSAIGLINGYIVAYLGVNSIIATLGMSVVLQGIVQGYTGGIPISTHLSSIVTNMSIQRLLGIPVLFLLMCLIAIATWYVLNQTSYGRCLSAVGSNLEAARLAGIPVRRIVMLSLVGSGLLAGTAGVLQIAAQGNADPQVGGIPFILPALAAVFLGATVWRPGKYNVVGTLIGLFFIAATISGLSLVGTRPWITDVFNGLAIVVALAVSAQLRTRRKGSADVGT
jgi:ribose transport system permease protein